MADFTLTVYEPDGTTVAWEVGTAATHARPYLAAPSQFGEAEVDLLEGRALIGQINLRVIDPQDGATQSERFFTALLADANGYSALNGRRAIVRQVAPSTVVVMDGVLYGVTLAESFAAFDLQIRDVRERGRKLRAFVNGGTSTVMPRGVLNGYGLMPSGEWLIPPTAPLVATYFDTGDFGSFSFVPSWIGAPGGTAPVAPVGLAVTDAMLEAARAEVVPEGDSYRVKWPRLEIRWRLLSGTGPFRRVTPAGPVSGPAGELIVTRPDTPIGQATGTRMRAALRLDYLDPTLPDADNPALPGLPTHGDVVELILLYVGEPTEDYPWHYEGTWGDLVRNLLRGDYCGVDDQGDPIDPQLRRDEAAILAINAPVRARLTEPARDLRVVLEQLCKAVGAAPALNQAGEIAPIRYALPGPEVVLAEINDSNCTPIAGWDHPASGAITVVEATYPRDYRVPDDKDPAGLRSAGDGIATREVTIRRAPADMVAALGERELELDLWMFRALGGSEGQTLSGDVADEQGAQIARERQHQALDRFGYGGVSSFARLRAADFPGLKEGAWVLDARSWRPNYQTGTRGGNTLAQVVSLRKLNPAWYEVRLVDAGPAAQPLGQPTLGAVSVDADGVVSVPVTAIPAGGEARVDFAISPSLPSNQSGLWTFLGRTAAPTTLQGPPQPAGVRVWIRSRSEGVGRRPSAWTNAVSVIAPGTPRLLRVDLLIETTGTPLVIWSTNSSAQGVRIYYAVHAPGTVPSLSTFLDRAAGVGETTLPVTAAAGQAVTVQVEPWSGWTGAAVSGTMGTAETRVTLRPLDPAVGPQGPAGPAGPPGQASDLPLLTRARQLPGSSNLNVSFTVRVEDPTGLGGVLSAWLAPTVPTSADPTGAADATLTLASTPATISPATLWNDGVARLTDIRVHPGQGKDIWLEFVNSAGTTTGRQRFTLRPTSEAITEEGDLDPDLLSQLALNNWRESLIDDTGVRYEWTTGSRVAEIWVYELTYTKPIPTDPWPGATTPTKILPATATSYLATAPAAGQKKYIQFEPRDASLRAGEIRRGTIEGVPVDSTPRILHIFQGPGATLDTTDIGLVLSDPSNRGGTLTIWTNKGSHDDANPSATPDGTYVVASTPATVTSVESAWLNDVKVHSARGKRVFFQFVAGGDSSGVIDFVLHSWLTLIDPAGELVTGAVKHAHQVAAEIRPPAVLPSLPTGNPDGVPAVFTGGKLYRWTGSAWDQTVPTVDLTGQVVTAQIADAAVIAGKLAASAVTEEKIASLAVTAAKVADAAVTTAKIADAAVQAGKLAAAAVTEEKIAALAVTSAKVADLAVTTAKIAAGAVDTAKLADSAATAAKIAASAITTTKIADDAVTTPKLVAGAITTAKLAAFAVEAGNLAVGAVVAGKIAVGAVTAGTIAANAVTATTIAADSITSSHIVGGAVTAVKLAAGSVEASKIAAGAVTAGAIAAGAVTAGKIAAGAVTATEIAAFTITTANLAASAVVAENIAAGAITAAKLAADSVVAGKIAAGAISSSALFVDGVVETRVLAAGAVVASKIAAGTITADKLSSLSIEVGKYIRSSNYVAGASGWSIDGSGAVEFNGGLFRGQLQQAIASGALATVYEALYGSDGVQARMYGKRADGPTYNAIDTGGGGFQFYGRRQGDPVGTLRGLLFVQDGATYWPSDQAVFVGGIFGHDGASAGFFGATPTTKPTVTGSRGGNAALESLLNGLAALGLITNSTS